MANTEQVDGIELTVMALRENLMEYFKGSCVKRFTNNGNIRYDVIWHSQPRLRHQYLRQQAEQQDKRMYFLTNTPLFTVSHYPETIVFHESVLNRSPELRRVYSDLTAFMSSYLAGVKVKINSGGVSYAD